MTTTTTGRATDFINFSRASLGTVTGSDGKVKWAGHNLLLASEQFDSASWTKGANVTIAANAAVAPNGTTTADKLTTSSGADLSANGVSQGGSHGGGSYTAGIWLRAATSQTVQLRLIDGSATIISSVSASVTSTWTLFTVSFANTTASSTTFTIRPDGANAISNLEIWGAHLYRSDLGGMVLNPARGDAYYPTTPKNLLGYTESFDNSAAWAKNFVNVTANVLSAPSGFATADMITASAGASIHRIGSAVATVPSGTPCVHSVYMKAGTHRYAQIHDGASASYFANFDLLSGTTGTVTGCTAAISAVGDGWYRCSIAMTLNVANPSLLVGLVTSSTAARNESWTAAGTETIYLWGAQLSDSASLDAYSANAFAAPTAAAYNAPRLDYGADGVAKGLLVEEQRTNLYLQSEAFDNASWNKIEATVTANATTSPDGTADADLFIPSVNALAHQVYQSISLTNATAYTVSIYAKAGGYNYVNIRFGGGISSEAFFDLSGGTVVSATTPANATIRAVGNGWYRCLYTATATSTASFSISINPCTTSSSFSGAGNGTSGVYVWGAQLEAGSFATSYIPTTSASVTRSADVASVATSAFPYSASEGTLVLNWDQLSASAGVPLVSALSSGTSSNYIGCLSNPSSFLYAVADGGVSQVSLTTGTVAANTAAKGGIVYKANDFAVSFNGGAVVTDTSGTVPAVSQMNIGSLNSGNFLNGHIRQITYLPRRLTNAELQARTA